MKIWDLAPELRLLPVYSGQQARPAKASTPEDYLNINGTEFFKAASVYSVPPWFLFAGCGSMW